MTGRPGDDLDWQAGYEARTGRTGQEDWVPAVTSIHRLAGSGRAPGSRVIAFATWLLALLGGGLMYVNTESAWAPLGRAAVAVLRLAAVAALYLLRTVLAPSGTLRGLRQMVLDAAPVPGTTRARRARGEPLPRPDHDHQIPEYRPGRPSEDTGAAEADGRDGDQGSGQPVIGFSTKKAAFLARYRGHSEYGNRSAAGRIAAELAPLAGLQAGTGRTYIAEELRKLTGLTLAQAPAEEDDDQPTR